MNAQPKSMYEDQIAPLRELLVANPALIPPLKAFVAARRQGAAESMLMATLSIEQIQIIRGKVALAQEIVEICEEAERVLDSMKPQGAGNG